MMQPYNDVNNRITLCDVVDCLLRTYDVNNRIMMQPYNDVNNRIILCDVVDCLLRTSEES